MGRGKVMFKKKRPKDVTLGELNSRLRGYILDSQIQNGHELSVLLGCTSLSDEVAEREEEESDKRLERISYLVPLLYAYSHTLSEGAVEYQRQNLPAELKELPDELWTASRRMMEQVTMSALMGAVSQLIDMGLLEVPRKMK
jgi:hypothetical protein